MPSFSNAVRSYIKRSNLKHTKHYMQNLPFKPFKNSSCKVEWQLEFAF